MPTQTPTKPTGAKAPQKPAQQVSQRARPAQQAQSARQLSMQATVNWMNPKEDESVRATASLTIAGAFAVHGIRLSTGKRAPL